MDAKEVLSKNQKIYLLVLILVVAVFLVLNYKQTLIFIIAFITFLYLIYLITSLYITLKSVFTAKEITVSEAETLLVEDWPKYTILCPLYHEANILPYFISNILNLDYPKDRLECLLLLEEDDNETINETKRLNLPDFFKIVVIKDSYPKTKPKACNVGLEKAAGEYVVIYDAEDRPDRDQLKKAVVAFSTVHQNVECIQAKLNFYNPDSNFLTKMFTSEYTLWFDLTLPGLQEIGAPIPLGGTSNHFRRDILQKLGGWDPYNVTEDCDLGIRLKEAGFSTVILDSMTWEEANSELKNWLRQRSRWIKGYFQTFLVRTRRFWYFTRHIGFGNFFVFMIMTGFMPISMMINPFLWIMTISYFVFRPIVGPTIESLFPAYILYPAVFCSIAGNFISFYNYQVASAKKQFDRYVKFGLLSPIYWFLISIGAWYGVIQLIYKPHFWEKTKHGLTGA